MKTPTITAFIVSLLVSGCAGIAPPKADPAPDELRRFAGKTITACVVRRDAGKLWHDIYFDHEEKPGLSMPVLP